MRIFDQRGYGSRSGTMSKVNLNTQWNLYLMKGQEPKTFAAAAQVFDVSSINYLYNECVGIVPDVTVRPVSSNADNGTIYLTKQGEAWFKGLSYFDAARSIAIPDRISSSVNDISMLFGAKHSNGCASTIGTVDLHYTNPMNFVGFLVDGGSGASTSTVLPNILIDSEPVTGLVKKGNVFELPEIKTGQTISIKETTSRGVPKITPLVAATAQGATHVPTYVVLAPASMNIDLAWAAIVEIPYVLTSLTYDTKEDALVYVLGTERSSPVSVVCRDIILGALEA